MWFWLAIIGWAVVIAAFALNRTLVSSTSRRFLAYLVGIPTVAVVTSSLIIASEECPPDVSDCDLAGLAGMAVAFLVVLVGFGTAIVCESIRAFLRAADRYENR